MCALLIWIWFWDYGLQVWDERDYDALALSILERHEFGFTPGDQTSLRPPLYPAFLAGVYACCGAQAFSAVRLLQALISILTVIVVYCLGAATFDERVGRMAALLTAFYPSLLLANNLLLTEVVFTFLLSLGCLLLIHAWQRNALTLFAAAGFVFALGALTRSVLWLLPPLLVAAIACGGFARVPRRLAAAAVLVCAFSITIAPWTIRNTRLQQTFTLIDVMGGRNFMMGNYEHTPPYRAWDAISINGDRSWHAILAARSSEFQGTTQGQRDKLALKYALRFALEHPTQTIQRDLIKMANFWQLEREFVAGMSRGLWGPYPRPVVLGTALVICGTYAFVLFMAVYGLVMSPKPSRCHVIFLLLIGLVWGVHTLVFAHSRYHLPLMPFVLIYAASGMLNARLLWSMRWTPRFCVAGLFCTLLAGSWLWEGLVTDRERLSGLVFMFQ